jgi:flagellar basal body P-ring protein FlgI
MATQGQNYATNQGNIAMNAANANAASNIAQQNATNSSIIGGLNLAGDIAANWNNPFAAWNNNQSTLKPKV